MIGIIKIVISHIKGLELTGTTAKIAINISISDEAPMLFCSIIEVINVTATRAKDTNVFSGMKICANLTRYGRRKTVRQK